MRLGYLVILALVAFATIAIAWLALPLWSERVVVLAGELGVAGYSIATLAMSKTLVRART